MTNGSAGDPADVVGRVVLKHPIKVGSDLVTELNFRRLKAKHLDGLKLKMGDDGVEVDFTQIKKLAGRLCGQSDFVMGELDVDDLGEVASLVMGFTGNSLLTGKSE